MQQWATNVYIEEYISRHKMSEEWLSEFSDVRKAALEAVTTCPTCYGSSIKTYLWIENLVMQHVCTVLLEGWLCINNQGWHLKYFLLVA